MRITETHPIESQPPTVSSWELRDNSHLHIGLWRCVSRKGIYVLVCAAGPLYIEAQAGHVGKLNLFTGQFRRCQEGEGITLTG